MKPFLRATTSLPEYDKIVNALEQKMNFKMGESELSVLKNTMTDALETDTYINDVYSVAIRYNAEDRDVFFCSPEMRGKLIHLSVKRNDGEAIHDWRDMQMIKNMLIGEEHEAFEIYPAESRLVDTSNQYHLFCFKSPQDRVGIGFKKRAVVDSGLAESIGGKQRKL